MAKPVSPSAIAGPFELFSVETGRIRLDGGAMFGVVPKTMWSKVIKPDEKNRIEMAMRLLLIKSKKSGRIYLVDTGAGDKFNEKMTAIYGLDYSHSNLVDSLAACSVEPEDITDIIFTHLHFDHCGGTTYYDRSGTLQHRFPNANYHVTRKQHESAKDPNTRERASFMENNIGPISQSDRLILLDDLTNFEEGLSTIPVFGHTAGQQLPVIEADGLTLVYAADLIPTHAHVPLNWVMGYDMIALQTLKEKQEFLEEAVRHQWHLFLEHDAKHEIITLKKESGRYSMERSLTLQEI